jgi:cation transport regulator ChaB
MPYSSNAELPKPVRQTVPEDKHSQFREVFNSVYEDTESEQRAFQAAWSAVEKMEEEVEIEKNVMDTLRTKAKEFNEKYGEKHGRVSASKLKQVYDRGIGAYKTNPGSVRPNVSSKEQWAFARVNSFLDIVRGAKSPKHDKDLLPKSDKAMNEEEVEKAEYQGEEVTLNKPFRLPSGSSKKFGVYVKDGDKTKKVTFGSPDMEIRRDDPDARSNFRARHNCDTATDKTSARYWSCRMWEADTTVSEMTKAEDVTGQILKVDEEQRLIYGWASVVTEKGEVVVDRQGDVIEAETLVKAVNDFMEHVRVGKTMHMGGATGQVIHSLPVTNEICAALGIQCDREGWVVAYKVYDDSVWDRVKSGELRAFSIGGRATKEDYVA